MADEKLLTFPCDFPIKIMGKNNSEFRTAVTEIVNIHYAEKHQWDERASKDANYLAITVTVVAESQEQLDRLYQDLSMHELILMVL